MELRKVTLEDFYEFDFIKRSSKIEEPYPFRMFGLEINEGWYPLVYVLCCHIAFYLKDQSDEFVENFYVTQIKEKFGGLRFYTSGADDVIRDLIRKAQNESFNTCEVCGQPGSLRPMGWKVTLCRKHFWTHIKERKYKRFYLLSLLVNLVLHR